MLKGFRDFILRGNVVELAVAVVIGVAFGAVVTSVVTNLITSLIGAWLVASPTSRRSGLRPSGGATS
jgi:large conductance mechanosensitive channel